MSYSTLYYTYVLQEVAEERECVGRYCLQWMLVNYPKVVGDSLSLIPEHGRWDDLFWLFPNALKLSDPDYVRRNYVSNISNETLEEARKTQGKIVQFICDALLASYKAFVMGANPSLLVKWLPTEGSALDLKFDLVSLICSTLHVSRQEYRVIYLTPMRRARRIVRDSYVCARVAKY